MLTISEAAVACGVHRDTVRDKLRAGLFDGAEQDGRGRWRIPVEALLAAGLHPHAAQPVGPAPVPDPTPASAGAELVELRTRVRELEAELAGLREAVALARLAMTRELGPGPAVRADPVAAWWRRLFGA